MKKITKRLVALLMMLILCLGLCACGGGESEDEELTGLIELKLWFPHGAQAQSYLEEITDAYNMSQDTYYVRVMNSGSLSEVRSKLEATIKPSDYPDLVVSQAIATCYYDEAKYIKDIQDFIDKDSEAWTTGIYDSVKTVYSDLDGNLLGWPLGVSSSGYWVNVDAIKKAGYTLDDITSFEKIAEIATATVDKGICKKGICFGDNGVELVDMLTLQGVDFVDKDNGTSGVATKSLLMKGETYNVYKKATDIITTLHKKDVALSYNEAQGTAAFPEFNKGELAFLYGTNSNSFYVVDIAEFEWAFVPAVGLDDSAKYKDCALTEGSGFYMCNTENEKKMQGAYEFIKFAAKPENQVIYCTNLGYVPYTDEAYQLPDYQTYITEKFPSLQGVLDKMKATPAGVRTPYTQAFDEMCKVTPTFLSYVGNDPNGDIDDYRKQAAFVFEEGIELILERQ